MCNWVALVYRLPCDLPFVNIRSQEINILLINPYSNLIKNKFNVVLLLHGNKKN